jgi:hypothetical protein
MTYTRVLVFLKDVYRDVTPYRLLGLMITRLLMLLLLLLVVVVVVVECQVTEHLQKFSEEM